MAKIISRTILNVDEIEKFDYSYAERVAKILKKKNIRMFNRLKVKIASGVDDMALYVMWLYDELNAEAKREYLRIAKHYYELHGGTKKPPTMSFVDMVLRQYNPVTLYVYENEVDRKKQRTIEAIYAREKANVADLALRYWSAGTTEYCLTIAEEAARQAMVDEGVESVVWVAVEDNRVCTECESRDGKIYPIDKIPSRPHYNCRCYFVPEWRVKFK